MSMRMLVLGGGRGEGMLCKIPSARGMRIMKTSAVLTMTAIMSCQQHMQQMQQQKLLWQRNARK